MNYLALVRHGESEWNAKGLWTGWTDIGLSEKGKEEAQHAGMLLRDIHFDIAFTSALKRAQQTLDTILHILNQENITIQKDAALNEKNYGKFTGLNKWDIKKQIGDEEFLKVRRSFDYRIPEGESLKDVYDRSVTYYKDHILPELTHGKNVLVSAHSNTLRALIKYLEHIADNNIANLELETGEVYIYQIDNEGKIVNKEIKK